MLGGSYDASRRDVFFVYIEQPEGVRQMGVVTRRLLIHLSKRKRVVAICSTEWMRIGGETAESSIEVGRTGILCRPAIRRAPALESVEEVRDNSTMAVVITRLCSTLGRRFVPRQNRPIDLSKTY